MKNDLKRDHLSVCICTFRRPSLLAKALANINLQETQGEFTFEIVVVDNDINRSAEGTVNSFRRGTGIQVKYGCEPEQSISLTRNRAIQVAEGNLIVFIDDDEFPDKNWLSVLHATYQEFKVDGVLGPVVPYYEGEPPQWLIKSELCIRASFQTGTMLNNPRYMRTGNVLFRKDIQSPGEMYFDPQFGLSGGEDADFFGRMLKKGRTLIWCDEARVFEHVPVERQQRRYMLKRALIRGVTEADQQNLISMGTLKSCVAILLYTAGLPFMLLAGQHIFMKYLVRDVDHVAKVLAHFGIKLVRERKF